MNVFSSTSRRTSRGTTRSSSPLVALKAASLVWLLALMSAANVAMAQSPQVGSNVPAESFLGEPFCFQAELANSGAPGYGPYLRLVLPVGLSFDSAEVFEAAANVVDVGVFGPPANELVDPFVSQPVTGPAGARLLLIEYPVGSVVTGGPDLIAEICLTIAPSAVVGTPLPISITPVYRYGDTATGSNGPIVGAPVVQPVTPTVITFEKTDTAPESERTPGPSWPYDYVLRVDIANTATINPIVINDVLPAGFQYTGPVQVTGGNGCSVTATPSTVTPGGNLQVTCNGNTVGTLADDDIVVTYRGHLVDLLDESMCQIQPVINTATVQASYVPASGPVMVLPPITDGAQVDAKHLALQKGAAPTGVRPGDIVNYTLEGQVSDFGSATTLVITDALSDGLRFDVGSATFTAPGFAGVTITPATSIDAGNGNQILVFDIGALAGTLTSGTAFSIAYTAEVQTNYEIAFAGEPLRADDPLPSTVSASYDMTGGAAGCLEDTAADVRVIPVSLEKSIRNPQASYAPGDVVTYVLTMRVPSGDARDVRFEDYLPLPVFDVGSIDLVFGNDIRLGPGHTLPTVTPDSISINAAQNAIFFDWPDLNTPGEQVLQLELDVTVVSAPFADDLFLTNLLLGYAGNTPGEATSAVAPVQIRVRAPVLVLTKGVFASSNPGAVIDPPPATLPVDGNISGVDAGDTITYRVTLENTGGAAAYDIRVNDVTPPQLTACALDSVTTGTGAPLASSGNLFTTGLVIAGPLAANDANPPGGGAPYGADTALVTYTCTVAASVQPGQGFDNTASGSHASQPGGPAFPPVEDDASATIEQVELEKSLVATSEGHTVDPRVAIGEIVRYRLAVKLPEGSSPAFTVTDHIPAGMQFLNDGSARLAFVANGAGISSSTLSGASLAISGNSAAVTPTFVIPAAAITPAGFGDGIDVSFALGNLVNADNDGDDEWVVIEFNALVLNVPGNGTGTDRDNSFLVSIGGSQAGPISNTVPVRTVQPAITGGKAALPNSGEAGDTIGFTITLNAAGGADNATAFDVRVLDNVPALLQVVPGSLAITTTGVVSGLVDSSSGNTIDVALASMAPGATLVIQFQAVIQVGVAPGVPVVNIADANWSSLPGSNGTSPNPTGSTTPGAPGTATGERPGTLPMQAPVNITAVSLAKTVVDTSEPGTGSGQHDPSRPDLLIGEVVTYRIVATVPEGTAPQVVITDTVPYVNGVLEVIGAQVVEIGSKLVAALPGTPLIDDLQLGDGVDDTAIFDFGQVVNSPTATGSNQIIVEVTAKVRDLPVNSNGDVLVNNALVQFGPGLNASASAAIDVVEPLLIIAKGGDENSGEAGDEITYTVTINHLPASTADARNVVFTDALPAGVVYIPGSLAVTGFTPTTSDDSGGIISVGWDNLPLGQSATITYQVNLAPDVETGSSITNTGQLGWTSLPDGNDPDSRPYTDSDPHTVVVSLPGVDKSVSATSELSTGSGQYGPDVPDLTIGEQVTYTMVVTFPDGVTPGAVFVDQLPTTTAVLELVSSRVVRVGSNLSGAGLPAVGTAGTPGDNDGDGVNDRATWLLGDVASPPTGAVTAEKQIVFEVVAVVRDLPVNQGGVVDQTNTATLTSGSLVISDSAQVDLVEPELVVVKSVLTPADGYVQAGDVVTHRIALSHAGTSSADAFRLVIADLLPTPGLDWIDDSTVSSTCAGTFAVDSSAAPSLVFTLDTLPLAEGSCQIEYDVRVNVLVNPGQSYTNSVVAEYDSTPVHVPGQTRRSSANDNASVRVIAPGLDKAVVATSLNETGSGEHDPALPDLAVGETVTYELTLTLPEGTTPEAVLVDTLPSNPATGVIRAIGADVIAVGGNITTTLPGTPVIGGGGATVTFNFGTITNQPDGVTNASDRIVVQITGVVADVPGNVDGAVLTNRAVFTYFGGGELEAAAPVEVVEPDLALSKSMVVQGTAMVRIGLTLTNNGTAPAFDLDVTDVLNEADWNLATVTPVSVPKGFELITEPGPGAGELTVRLRSNPSVPVPGNALLPGQAVAVTFDVALAAIPPASNPVLNQADLVGGSTMPGDNKDERELPPLTGGAQLPLPLLALSKQASPTAPVAPGDSFSYTLVVTNSGLAAATNVTVDDVPDGNVALVVGSVTTTLGTVVTGNSIGDETVSVLVGTLAAGGSATLTFQVTVDNPLPAGVVELVNQAVAGSTELPDVPSDDPTEPGDTDPTIVPVAAAPDLAITKADGGVSTVPGGVVIYTLSYGNNGNQGATGVEITETVPANTAFEASSSSAGWSCPDAAAAGESCVFEIGDLAAGASGSIAFAVRVVDPLPAGVTEIANTAIIGDDGSNGPDPTPGDNSSGDTTPVVAVPDLTLAKTDGDIATIPGGIVVYTLAYANVGNQDATGVTITETVPANTTYVAASSTVGWSCADGAGPGSTCVLDIGDVAAGDADVAVFALRVDNPLPNGVVQIANTALVGDDGNNGPDPTPGDNEAGDTTPVAVDTGLTISKVQSSGPNPVSAAGQVVGYTIVVTNVGNSIHTGVVVGDTLPDGSDGSGALVGPVESIAPNGVLDLGETWTYTISYTTTQADIKDGSQLVNLATVVSNQSTTPIGDSAVTPVVQNPGLLLEKTAGVPTGNSAGSTIQYTFAVTNTGNLTVSNLVINDPQLDAPAVCLVTTLPPGDSTTCTGTHAITQDEVDAGEVLNSATAGGELPGGDPIVSPPDGTRTPIVRSPSLALVKTAGTPTGHTAGSTIEYTFAVTNTGNVTITDLLIDDPQLDAPAVCLVTTLAPTESTTCTGTHTITQAEVDAGEVLNTATAIGTSPGGTDPVVSLPDSTQTPITQTPLLALVKSAGTPTGNTAGSTITYTFTVTNTGNVTLTDLVIDDAQLDAPAVCLVTTLAPTETTTCTGVHTITQDEVKDGEVLNTATAIGTPPGGADPVVSLPDSTQTPITQTPGLVLEKTAGVPSGNTAGSTITYTFTVTNTGNLTVTGLVINDPQLDAPAVCLVTTLAPTVSTTCTGTHTITQAEVDAGEVLNSATAGGTLPGGEPIVSPPDSTQTPITPAPALVLEKTAGVPSGNSAGSTIQYTFLVTNTGNVTITGLVINDTQLDAPAVCVMTTLAPTESTTCTGTHTITQDEIKDGEVLNTATAGGSTPGGDPVVSPPDSTQTPIAPAPGLVLEKTAGVPSGNTAGSTIQYTFAVTNTGNLTVTGLVIDDPQLDAPAVCLLTTLAPTESTTCTGTHTITQDEIDAGQVLNTATAGGSLPGGDPIVSPPDSTQTPTTSAPALALEKTAGEPTAFSAGSTIPYTFVVTNTGNVTITGLVIDDPQLDAPAVCLVTTLAPTESTTCTGMHTVTQDEVDAGEVLNTATAGGSTPGGDPIVSPPDSTQTPLQPGSALVLVKTATLVDDNGNGYGDIGEVVQYSLVATNNGKVTLTGVTIVDPLLPVLTCTPNQPATLAVGDTLTCQGSWTITAADIGAGETLVNVATATGTAPDGSGVDDEDQAVIPLGSRADLVLVKTVSGGAAPGAAITWQLLISNHGPSAADGALFLDSMPAGVTGITAVCGSEQGGATCGPVTVSSNEVSGSVAVLPAGGSVRITITGNAPATGGTLVNVAVVQPPDGVIDPVESNNEGSASVVIGRPVIPATPVPVSAPWALLLLMLLTGVIGGRALRRTGHLAIAAAPGAEARSRRMSGDD